MGAVPAAGAALPRALALAGGVAAAWALRSRWVTMANRPVLIDPEGRIEGGGVPSDWRGVHIQDVAPVARELRSLEDAADQCEQPTGRATFPSIEAGVSALLDANPDLVAFLEAECGSQECDRYRRWVAAGRRGRKPRAHPSEGRFDLLNELYDKRKPGQKVASWLEAVYVTVPKSRRWEDFEPRINVLAEATGVPVVAPEESQALEMAAGDVQACQAAAERRIDDVLQAAKEGRHGMGPETAESWQADDDVPF